MRRRLAASLAALVIASCGAPSAAATPRPTASGPAHVVTAVSTTGVNVGPSPTIASGNALIELGDHWYLPARLTVLVGTTVTWKMVGSQEHDVWAVDGSFHSPTLNPGMSYSYTFKTAGVFKYFCVPHYGDGMTGSVTVVDRR